MKLNLSKGFVVVIERKSDKCKFKRRQEQNCRSEPCSRGLFCDENESKGRMTDTDRNSVRTAVKLRSEPTAGPLLREKGEGRRRERKMER